MPAERPIRLRGHHFLCMLTYRGLGYSAEFTANMTAKISHIKAGAPVVLAIGPDDICAGMSRACRHATGHDCGMADILDMDKTARKSVENILGRQLDAAAPITPDELNRLRSAFSTGSIRNACAGCSWFEVCNQIVDERYLGTHLQEVAK
jgi:uncharacterized protein